MKFCPNCGRELADDMKFCQKCGTKMPEVSAEQEKTAFQAENFSAYTEQPPVLPNKRKGLKVLSIICFVSALIYALMAIGQVSMLAMVPFMIIVGIMFFVLSGTPKGSKEICIGKSESGGKQLKKSVFIATCLITAFIIFGVLMGALGGKTSTNNKAENSPSIASPSSAATSTTPASPSPSPSPTVIKPAVILDVTQFANISSAQLKGILGEPSKTEKTDFKGTVTVPCVYYDYDNIKGLSEVEFTLINDKVIEMLTYTDLSYGKGQDMLSRLGITKPENTYKAVDQKTAVRYRCPTSAIDDVWVGNIDSAKDTFGFLRVTYDLFYSEQWYVPVTTQEQASYTVSTKDAVKSILKSPKSADFPFLDWSFAKNPWYVAVQSYVDAQNSFGANIRSNFTFIYSSDTGNLVYAIFDGKEVYNDGYVKFEDLVKKIAAAN